MFWSQKCGNPTKKMLTEQGESSVIKKIIIRSKLSQDQKNKIMNKMIHFKRYSTSEE